MKEIFLYDKAERKAKNVLNVAMAYPSQYLYGMSVLGFLSMFKEFDKNEHVRAQRLFLDSYPLAFSPEKLDALGFSYIFEGDIFNILKMLKEYNIPPEASKRQNNYPLVFAGGPVVTANPEPFADFFDFMIIGDGESFAKEFSKVYLNNKNKPKEELLRALSKIDGVYAPSLYNVKYENEIQKSFYPLHDDTSRFVIKRHASNKECLYSPIISDKTFYANTAFVELVRGCPYECKFCPACWHNKPARYFDFASIKKAVKKAAKYAEKITFIGAMITAHPDFDELCIYLKKLKEKRNFKVEFSSLGFDKLCKYVPQLIDEKTISFAIECGSEEQRAKIGKNLSDEKIFKAFDYYINSGIEKINLYFMIGLPEETIFDIDKYIDFSVHLTQKYKNIKFCHIISTFNPKPNTPFEKEKRESVFELDEKIQKIKKTFKENKIMAYYPNPKRDAFNALIGLSDRRLGKYLKYIFENDVKESEYFKTYKKCMEQFNLPHYSKYIYSAKKAASLLPWKFIKFMEN